ncbi:MAG: hypothetical protein ACREVQ_13980 [Burkholderiales bacterium]
MKRIAVLAAALVLAAPLARAAEGWRFGAQGDAIHDDNATRGIYDGAKADNLVSVQGDATNSILLSPQSGLVLRGLARYTAYNDITDFSNLALGARAAWRIQPSLGFDAPWYEIAGEVQRLLYPDSDLRDGWLISADASVGAYVTDRMRLSGGFGIDKRSGGGSAGVFDYTQNRLFGNFDLRVGVNTAVYARLTRIGGDQVFSSGSHQGGSAVWENDPALQGPLGLATANLYRIDATTMAWELGVNVPFGPGRAFDFGLQRYDSKVNDGLFSGQKYSATVLRASILYRFQ